MDTLGNSEICEAVEAAAFKALHDWGHPREEADDLVQDIWQWYLERPSTQEFVSNATTATGRRNVFYRGASQILSEQQLQANVFRGQDLYSSDAVKDWLDGTSTNRSLGRLIQQGLSKLEDQNSDQRAMIRVRYEEGIIPPIEGGERMKLSRAVKSLTSHVNALAIEDQQAEKVKPLERRGVSAGSRRGGGGYSDPTADMALGLIKAGDVQMETASGEVTTMRKEFEDADNIMAQRYDHPTPPWIGIDLFEGELNDRTDMYRAQVFPELYPNEKPMLVDNWPREDQEAYLGGEYTVGYRRLKVVK